MEFISGSKEYFFDFLDNLKKTDRIAVLSHTDLDGIACALIFNKIISGRGLKIKHEEFIDLGVGFLEKMIIRLKKKKINKVFLFDLSVSSDIEGFRNMEKSFECLVFDHHPGEINGKNILKTESKDCSTFALYELFKNRIRLDHLNKIVCATIIGEITSQYKEEFNFLKKNYPEISKEKVFDSIPGNIAKSIGSTLACMPKKQKTFLKWIEKDELRKFVKYQKIVDKEINRLYLDYQNKKEDYQENRLHIYLSKPKFNITSILATKLALEKQEDTIIIISKIKKERKFLKASARNNLGKQDVNLLMKKGIEGLEQASGGGHVKAAAARFLEKDLEKFKQNLIT